jgi:hypothetical protein
MLALPVAVPHSCCRCATQSGPTAAPPELLLPHSAPAAARSTSGGVPGARAASTPCRNAACTRASALRLHSVQHGTHRVAVEERVADAAVAHRPDHLVPRLRVQRVAARKHCLSARANTSQPQHAHKLQRDAAVADEQHAARGVEPRRKRAHVVCVAQLKHRVRSGAGQLPRPRAGGDAQAVVRQLLVPAVCADDAKHLRARTAQRTSLMPDGSATLLTCRCASTPVACAFSTSTAGCCSHSSGRSTTAAQRASGRRGSACSCAHTAHRRRPQLGASRARRSPRTVQAAHALSKPAAGQRFNDSPSAHHQARRASAGRPGEAAPPAHARSKHLARRARQRSRKQQLKSSHLQRQRRRRRSACAASSVPRRRRSPAGSGSGGGCE